MLLQRENFFHSRLQERLAVLALCSKSLSEHLTSDHQQRYPNSPFLQEMSTPPGIKVEVLLALWLIVLTQMSRSRFKQTEMSLLIPNIYVLGCFVNVSVIFGYIWGEIVFLSKIDGYRKFGRFDVVLKLEFEIRNW